MASFDLHDELRRKYNPKMKIFQGESGTQALVASLETFLKEGGQSVHYNVLDTETLKDAQIHPEEHSNLQVRVCGWNELFVNMSKEWQDEFIARSQMHMR